VVGRLWPHRLDHRLQPGPPAAAGKGSPPPAPQGSAADSGFFCRLLHSPALSSSQPAPAAQWPNGRALGGLGLPGHPGGPVLSGRGFRAWRADHPGDQRRHLGDPGASGRRDLSSKPAAAGNGLGCLLGRSCRGGAGGAAILRRGAGGAVQRGDPFHVGRAPGPGRLGGCPPAAGRWWRGCLPVGWWGSCSGCSRSCWGRMPKARAEAVHALPSGHARLGRGCFLHKLPCRRPLLGCTAGGLCPRWLAYWH
jgi:hypothetical protein